MVSGVTDATANQDRAEDGIDDEPGNPIGGMAVLSRLAKWSIDSLVRSALQATQKVQISPKKRWQLRQLPQITELSIPVLVGQDLIGAVGGEKARPADREHWKSDIGIVRAIHSASTPRKDKRVALAYWNELRDATLAQGKTGYGVSLGGARIGLKPLGPENAFLPGRWYHGIVHIEQRVLKFSEALPPRNRRLGIFPYLEGIAEVLRLITNTKFLTSAELITKIHAAAR